MTQAGVQANELNPRGAGGAATGGLGGRVARWLGSIRVGSLRLGVVRRPAPRLAVLQRIALAPRQTLALIEADGQRFLVATSADGAAAFQSLDHSACSREASTS